MSSSNKTGQHHHTRVAYRPLTDLAKIDELDLEVGGGGGGEGEDDEELEVTGNLSQGDSQNETKMTKDYASATRRSYHLTSKQHTRQVLIGLRQLRTILLALAALLSLIFLLKLIAYSSQPSEPPRQSKSGSPRPLEPISARMTFSSTDAKIDHQVVSTFVVSANTTRNKNLDDNGKQQVASAADDKRPEYDNYLSSIIYERDHKAAPGVQQTDVADSAGGSGETALVNGQWPPVGELLDDFRYSLGDRRTTLGDGSQEEDTASTQNYRWWSVGRRGQCTTVINFIRPMKSFNYNKSVTLATHLTLGVQSFRHTLELCERWQGPISVAVHLSRGLDSGQLPAAITLIKFVRQCLPAPLSACMRDKLTWHLVWFEPTTPRTDHLFAPDSLSYPKYHLDSIHYSAFASTDQCPKLAVQDAASNGGELINQFELDILKHNGGSTSSASPTTSPGRVIENDPTTPVNLLRNVARSAARTKWVLTSDVDLYPSPVELAPRFIGLATGGDFDDDDDSRPRLFALPTFELINCNRSDQLAAIRTKQEIVALVRSGGARVYHEPDCDGCHEFARQQDWLALSSSSSAVSEQDPPLQIFETVRLGVGGVENPRVLQPFFITESQPSLPEYNETLSGDRSALMYETCLKDYQLVVLADAFLVRPCENYQINNNQQYQFASARERSRQRQLIGEARSKLREHYKNSPNINKC